MSMRVCVVIGSAPTSPLAGFAAVGRMSIGLSLAAKSNRATGRSLPPGGSLLGFAFFAVIPDGVEPSTMGLKASPRRAEKKLKMPKCYWDFSRSSAGCKHAHTAALTGLPDAHPGTRFAVVWEERAGKPADND
jgi:hypothetical protein